jgi:MtaA/CmuA family methyltransferase
LSFRKRVESSLRIEEPDRVPVMPPFQGYWALGEAGLTVEESIRDPQKAADAQLSTLEACRFDGIEILWDWIAVAEAIGCKVKIPEKGNPVTVERIVKAPEDIDNLTVPNIRENKRTTSGFDAAKILKEKIGNSHFTYITLALPFTLAGELRGVESFMVDLMKRSADAHKLIKFSTEVLLIYLEEYVNMGFEAIFWCDPTASADLISPKQFKEFSLPYIKEVVKKTREKGLSAFIHICGDTTQELEMICEAEPNLMSVDMKVDLRNAKEKIGDKITILGNVHTDTLFQKSSDEVFKAAVNCVNEAGKRGYVLGAGCDIPVGTPLENVKSLVKAVEGGGI